MSRPRPSTTRACVALAGLAVAAGAPIAAAAPSAPTVTSPAAGYAVGPNLNVTWTAATFDPLAAGARYTVAATRVGGGAEPAPVTVDSPATQAQLTGLASGGTYQITVTASELPCLDEAAAEECVNQAGEDGRISTVSSNAPAVTLDASAPTASILLNGGAAWTTEPQVQTGLAAADASPLRMLLGASEAAVACGDPATCGSPFEADPAFTLAGPDGLKTVYARVVDPVGNAALVSDTIGLDTTAPDLWATANSLEVTVGETVQFSTRQATDGVSGLNESSFAWSFCATCAPSATGRTASRNFAAPGKYLVSLFAEDVAGNRGVDSFELTVTEAGGGGGTTPGGGDGGGSGAPASGGGPATGGSGAAAAGTLAGARIVGTPRVGSPVKVKVTLVKKSKVVFDVMQQGSKKLLLLKRFAPRRAFKAGTTVYQLAAPSRAGTRVLRIRAGKDVRTLPLQIRGR